MQLAVIYKSCSENGGCHVAMFSATMAHDVEQWCKLNLDNPVNKIIFLFDFLINYLAWGSFSLNLEK